MSLELTLRYHLRCDHCGTTLRSSTTYGAAGHTQLLSFPTPLAALHRAIEAHWSVRATAIFCPACTQDLDDHPKDT